MAQSKLLLSGIIFLLTCVIVSYSATLYQHGDYGNAFATALKLRQSEKEERQDLSKIPGEPGIDYPVYHTIPETRFSCKNVPALPGIYANIETGCQAYHVCHDGREGNQGASFLCSNGTVFNQAEFTCDWWYNVKCHESPELYRLNLDPYKNPYFSKAMLEKDSELLYQQQPYF